MIPRIRKGRLWDPATFSSRIRINMVASILGFALNCKVATTLYGYLLSYGVSGLILKKKSTHLAP